jgi:flagellar capping protein FliD
MCPAGAATFSRAQELSWHHRRRSHLTSTAAGRGAAATAIVSRLRKYPIDELHQGQGVANGSFTITAANGATGKVTLASSTHKTVGDVIESINDLGIGVEARINADGDGIELVDATGGSGLMMVAETNSGTTAADLGIVGQAKAGSTTITGTFSAQVTIASGDTLDALVKKINAAGAGVTASVLNDGTPYTPYRWSSPQSARHAR